jgi:hypothetical protein
LVPLIEILGSEYKVTVDSTTLLVQPQIELPEMEYIEELLGLTVKLQLMPVQIPVPLSVYVCAPVVLMVYICPGQILPLVALIKGFE